MKAQKEDPRDKSPGKITVHRENTEPGKSLYPKVVCEHCGNNLKSKVREPFDKFQVGRVVCPVCKKENKRYISEYDLLFSFNISCFIYMIAVISIAFIFKNTELSAPITSLLISFSGIILVLIAGFLGIDATAKNIYLRAPFKTAWKSHVFDEDSKAVGRRINMQFIIFICVSLFVGADYNFLGLYLFFALSMIAINSFKTFLAHKNEARMINPSDPQEKNR